LEAGWTPEPVWTLWNREQVVLGRTNHLRSFDTTQTAQETTHPTVLLLDIHCRGNVITEGFMKYAVEMGSGAMIYIPSFINIGSGIPKLIEEMHRHTESMVIL
jgi:hypothetical protein